MKKGFSVCIFAVIAGCCILVSASAPCYFCFSEEECRSNYDSLCKWTLDDSMNGCTQSVECLIYSGESCQAQPGCEYVPNSCSPNLDICQFNSHGDCNVEHGCIHKLESSTPIPGGFNCAFQSKIDVNTPCDKTKPYCMQNPLIASTCESKRTGTCLAKNNSMCAAPCYFQGITCGAHPKCSHKSPNATNCLEADGCLFTPGNGDSLDTCSPIADCASIDSLSDCYSQSGCTVTNFDCSTPDNLVSTYCNSLGEKGCSAAEQHCSVNLNKTCVDNLDYCSTPGLIYPNYQCNEEFSCSNPKAIDCSNHTTHDKCDGFLCQWRDTRCNNISWEHDCNNFDGTLSDCIRKPGCGFVQGGKCDYPRNLRNLNTK